MPNGVFLATAAAAFLFLASGGIELGFSLVVQSQMNRDPTDGREAVRNLLYQRLPLTAGIVNGVFIIIAFLFMLPGLLMHTRLWMKVGGYVVTCCGVFTLSLGLYIWIMTLQTKDTFAPIYANQDTSVQDLMQTSFQCCGYLNHTSPAFITDATCPSPAAAALSRGCATSISTFSNVLLDTIFTALFGMVAADAVLVLSIACLLKDRKERERYRLIDEKSGFRQI